jgi:hypothetical protein
LEDHVGTKRTTIALALATAVLASGCQDDGGSASPEPGPDTTSAAGEPTESDTPTQEPEETVAPATGPELDMGTYTIRVPEGWRVRSGGPFSEVERLPRSDAAVAKSVFGMISPTSFPSVRAKTLDEEAREHGGDDKRLPDVVIDGEPAYHFRGLEPGGFRTESFGLNYDYEGVRLSFSLFGGTRQQQEDLIASVLASWQWR